MTLNADQWLLERIREGDEAAWAECISRFEGRLLAFVNRRLRDPVLSEDIVQDTFVGFLTSLPNYDHSKSLEAFLFAIATYKLTDALRRKGVRSALPIVLTNSNGQTIEPVGSARRASSLYRGREAQIAEEQLLQQRLKRLIQQWLQSGDYERLKCIELLFVLGWANKRVAEYLGISEQAVANHKSFVMSKLKEAAV